MPVVMNKASRWSDPVVPAKRRPMTPARKRRIHAMREGTCYRCGTPDLPVTGPWVIYEHRPPLGLLEEDVDERVFLSCAHCAEVVTPLDISDIAKAKRLEAVHRGEKKKPQRPLKGQGFRRDPLKKRTLQGKVVDR